VPTCQHVQIRLSGDAGNACPEFVLFARFQIRASCSLLWKRDTVVLVICALTALLIIVVGVLTWSVRYKPTRFRLTLKLWKLIHLELESETLAT
jgi:hypothetical protein